MNLSNGFGQRIAVLLVSGILLSACETTGGSSGGSSPEPVERTCVTSSDTEFARLESNLRNQISYFEEKSGVNFNKCGWIESKNESGTTYRYRLSDLNGDINFIYGKPVYLMASRYSYRFNGERNFTVASESKRVGYITTSGLTASERAVNRLNNTIRSLSRVATGQTVQTRSGAEQAASVERTQGRVRAVGAVVGQIAAAGANAQTSSPQASSSSSYQCTVVCSTNSLAATMGTVGESARNVVATVNAPSNSAARRLAMDDRAQICRQANLSAVATIVAPTCN